MNASGAPCHSVGSGAETAQCFYEAAKKANSDLNRFYGILQRKLSPGNQEKLQATQRVWVRFRDANCEAERQLYTGGSAAPMVFQSCIEADTRERTKELHTMYDWLIDK